MMASKRKREDDIEYTPSSAKMSKNEDSSSVSRSGRARKKPARFLDQDEEDESSPETPEVETKPVEIQILKSSPNLLAATPQIISSTPQLIMATPQIINADSQLISNPTQLISVAPQSISTAPQLISSIPQLISSAPQLITSISQLINTTPQLIASSPQVISGTPQMIVSPESIIQPKIEPSDTPKQSRVRKKSAKVIEMEEFEKAEKVKSTKKTPKVGSPEFSTVTASTAAGGIQPQILQAANIQLNLMNALNTSTSNDVQSSLLAHLRKNPQLVRVVDDQKLGSIKTEPMVSGPFVSPGEAVMGDQHGSVKDEPIDTVDPNILLPQSAPGSALLTHLTKMAQQEGNVSPTKTPPKKKIPKAKTVKEEPVTSMAGDSQSKSVIKMLLNKPAQFSEPVISTQTLSQINSPVSDKNVKKPIRLKLSTESTPVSQIGPSGDAPFGHVAPAAITGSMDTGRPSTSSAGMDIKKKIKKTKRKQSVSILDEDDDDDEEYDEEEDDDDDDLMEDDLDDNDDEMDWEFETQDGNLIIADETPKKSTKKTPPSKKKGKKDENQSNSGAGKEKKGPKEKKRKRLTAYTMWCNSVRYKVLNENPGIDFAQLSRRLGEIWQSVPAKDKMRRKRRDLSLADRYEAVKLLEQKLSQTEVAKRMGCSQPQICLISKNRESIKADYEASENPQRKRQRSGKAPSVEGALKDWFTMARSKDIPLSSTILQEKATSLATTMQIEDFNPTAGWLSRWKQRNNLGYKKSHGEKKDADLQAAEHWTTRVLTELLQEYTADDIYNADEMGIYYRALPDKILTFKSEKTAGSKKAKDRVTALVCVNMTGTDKRKLLVIGKSRDPRCFHGKKSLPVTYKSSTNAWMTGDIFCEWLKEFNRDMVRQRRKVLLLVDNCSAHPKEAAEPLSNVRMEFLAANTTSMIQPCNMGIIRNLKVLYRTGVVRKLVEDIDSVATAMDLARKLTMLDAVHLLSKAWKNVKMTTIVNCYRKAGFLQEEVEAEEEIVVPDGMTREEFYEYIDHDKDLECYRVSTDEDLCAKFMEDKSRDLEERSEDETETGSGDLDNELPTSVNGANKCMDYMRRFLEENGCDDFSDYYGLQEKCEIIALKKKRQSMITEFIDLIP